MKVMLQYIGYIMAICGFAAVIWKAALFFDKKDDKTNVLETKMQTVIDKQDIQTNQNVAIFNQLDILTIKVDKVITSQQGLKNSYSLYLKNDSSLTKKDFVIYMETMDLKKNK
jgi:hypothetical protein